MLKLLALNYILADLIRFLMLAVVQEKRYLKNPGKLFINELHP
jgi:hypothetical protein